MTFIFGADVHIVEPADLFTAEIPKSLAFRAMRGDFRCTMSGDKEEIYGRKAARLLRPDRPTVNTAA